MTRQFGDVALNVAFRVVVPFTLVYGIYVLTHGEFGPGGGFQAGALLAVGVVLSRLILGRDAQYNVSGNMAVILAGAGAFLYAATGFLPLFFGGNFLEYSHLPFPAEELHELHATGILMIETGVTVCVMMTIINILDSVTERADRDD